MELNINKLKEKGLKFNIEKLLFVQTEMEYLGFWVTHNDVKTTNRKIESITNMKPPTYQKQLRKLIGVMNYYRIRCPRRSHNLSPLTRLPSIENKFKWMQVEQDDFEKNKRIVTCDTLLTHSYFNKTFKIHTDGRYFQLGAVIRNKGKLITFYSMNSLRPNNGMQ